MSCWCCRRPNKRIATTASTVRLDIEWPIKEDPSALYGTGIHRTAGVALIEFIPLHVAILEKEIAADRSSTFGSVACGKISFVVGKNCGPGERTIVGGHIPGSRRLQAIAHDRRMPIRASW